jgi:hypothetical protein
MPLNTKARAAFEVVEESADIARNPSFALQTLIQNRPDLITKTDENAALLGVCSALRLVTESTCDKLPKLWNKVTKSRI